MQDLESEKQLQFILQNLEQPFVVSDRQEEAAKDVVAGIVAGGGNAISIPADVTSFEAVENLVAQTVKEFGRLGRHCKQCRNRT